MHWPSASAASALLFLWVISLAHVADAKVVRWEGTSCTGTLPVCRDGESPFTGAEKGTPGTQVCHPNTFNRPYIVLEAQNWPSALYNDW
jgi:hypothetical protein